MSVATPVKSLFRGGIHRSPTQQLDFGDALGSEGESELSFAGGHDFGDYQEGIGSPISSSFSDDRDDSLNLTAEGEWDPTLATPKSSPSRHRPPRRTSSRCQENGETSVASPHFRDFRRPSDSSSSPSPMLCGTSPASSAGDMHNSPPPHKRLRNLRLFDSPHTPKSLIQKASASARRNKLLASRLFSEKPAPTPSGDAPAPAGMRRPHTAPNLRSRRNRQPKQNVANVNPFTPSAILQNATKKRLRQER